MISDTEISQFVDRFHRDGFLLIEGALTPEQCTALRSEVDLAMDEYPTPGLARWVRSQMFLRGPVFEELLDHPPAFDVAEKLLSFERGDKRVLGGEQMWEGCQVMNVTSMVSRGESPGDLWHVDDFLLFPRPEGIPWDDRIPFPVFIVSALYYLNDLTAEMGPTLVVPGSHKAGYRPDPKAEKPTYEGRGPQTVLARAGDCLLFHSQLWHRADGHRCDRPRYVQQVHYGARFISQRLFPMPNFHMPQDFLLRLTPRRQRLMGMHACWGQFT
ncbi:MAG: phytanoyl-CoA dioxygenase family protein [Planctomycetota bacterium]